MKAPKPFRYRELAKYAEGEVTASDAAEMEQHLKDSPDDRRRLTRVGEVMAVLRDTAEVDNIDLLPGLRAQIAKKSETARSTRRRGFSVRHLGLMAAGMVGVMVPIFLFLGQADSEATDTEGFTAKTARSRVDARSRWISLNVFRLSGNTEPAPLQKTLHTDDGVLFAYTNLGPEPFSHLMVFAVDDQHQVYWYYPAFLDVRDDPNGITIEKGVSRAGLQEVVVHPFPQGTVTIYGLFSDEPHAVSEVEAAVRRGIVDNAELESALGGVRVKSVKAKVIQ